ncbi:peroxiredoxin [Sporanaerobium hydrogeniformans]|uniref:Peroxiredoxin n=1 Tax=Sporanaerobium hydrogeniformans TaxID=3072179 RepID=A0AC61DDT1_9FIRM|nr:peroxiredoxin [Sporanaerobium hydrogeniformans]PHV70866.1 peroxiredoxin [Sporanaerobium hydrogeniformans]
MMNSIPLIGDQLPEMTVQTTYGIKKLPEDYKGKWLILFSHPGDFTPVCTTEFVSFARNYETFQRLNTELLGLSIDQVQPHMKWVEWIEDNLGEVIPFPIIADPLGDVAKKLGMIQPARKTSTVRATFFIDPDSKVRLILYYPAEIGRNMEEIIRSLVALQVATENGVAMPANWPNNELIGDQVIIPPPTTIPEADERPKEYTCYDWWFCYKPLDNKK